MHADPDAGQHGGSDIGAPRRAFQGRPRLVVRHLARLRRHSLPIWIRRQRLERARRALADPAMRTTPINAIAARSGFSRAADFTRAFRRAYGVSPRGYRNHASTQLPPFPARDQLPVPSPPASRPFRTAEASRPGTIAPSSVRHG
ncbi:helix-turn-helix domain-containing protein [Streptomyces cinerochromogenes]|uniref:Helix-turn-helix domain-containing protein n=1 Tax=Streptomyces cinerochromogenes TaxID=66422 RepID=A0ABW7BCX7_9ACTN